METINDQWKKSASALGLQEKQMWIDGEWIASDNQTSVVDPATGNPFAEAPLATSAELQQAIDGAAIAFNSWKKTSAHQRGQLLKRIAAELIRCREELATILLREQGKPRRQALGEVDYAASFFEWYGEEARRLGARNMPHPEIDREFIIEPVAIGVAGLITPWNFPLAQGAKKAAAAIAAGCTVVWKPSELTPLVALVMGPLTKRCDLPPGVMQIIPATGPVTGEAFAKDFRIKTVSVTGSTRTGQIVYAAGAHHLQRVTLELGGNAPFIVLDDADLETTASHLCQLKMLCSGQVCVTANRVFVPESLMTKFSEKVAGYLSSMRLGNGNSLEIDAGPLIHQGACERVTQFIESAVADGAQIVCENRSYEKEPPPIGASFHPAVLLNNVPENTPLSCEEVFGPVISLMPYKSLSDVIDRANDTTYGLAGYVYGREHSRMRAVASALEVGIVGINEWRPLKAEIPFGGVKMSGLGAEGGQEGIREFLEQRVISVPRTSVEDLA